MGSLSDSLRSGHAFGYEQANLVGLATPRQTRKPLPNDVLAHREKYCGYFATAWLSWQGSQLPAILNYHKWRCNNHLRPHFHLSGRD